jgi:ribosomal protein S18 acetylase RimI-like enzyme
MSQDNQDQFKEITCEDITDEIMTSYNKQGFNLTFAEEIMQYDLSLPVPEIVPVVPISFVSWNTERGHDFFTVYQAAFRERPGFPDWSEERWIQWIADDPTFRPDRTYLAIVQGKVVGFIADADDESSQQTGYIIQVGVHPDWRGKKIGASLVTHAMLAWQNEGKASILLHVNVNNPGAIDLYQKLGFITVGRRGKFRRQSN